MQCCARIAVICLMIEGFFLKRAIITMNIKIIPYSFGSGGAKALQAALQALGYMVHRVRKNSATYTHSLDNTVINWGCSSIETQYDITTIINPPEAVAKASNKLIAFKAMDSFGGINLPDFTTDWRIADDYANAGFIVIERNQLNGHSGSGIRVIIPNLESGHHGIDHATPLYVKYIKKQSEYRVHVFDGGVIDVQQKRRRIGIANEAVDFKVRSHDNGWVFCRSNIEEPNELREQAIKAVEALGLTFGAVDIIYNSYQNKCYVLEVNTACGMENTTVVSYVNAFIKYQERDN